MWLRWRAAFRPAERAPTADLLAALDQALAQPAATAVMSRQPAANPVRTREQAQRAAQAGHAAYRAGDLAEAEREFARLAALPGATAVDFYFLGLSQWRLGRAAEAEQAFRRGWALERDGRPPPGAVEAAFERLDRADREVVNLYRH